MPRSRLLMRTLELVVQPRSDCNPPATCKSALLPGRAADAGRKRELQATCSKAALGAAPNCDSPHCRRTTAVTRRQRPPIRVLSLSQHRSYLCRSHEPRQVRFCLSRPGGCDGFKFGGSGRVRARRLRAPIIILLAAGQSILTKNFYNVTEQGRHQSCPLQLRSAARVELH